MDNRVKTVQITIPEGNGQSIKIAELVNRLIQVIFIPRGKLKDGITLEETKKSGIYFLFGEKDAKIQPIVYIGEAGNCAERLLQHHKSKDFWNEAVIVTTINNSFNDAHIKYLEWYNYEKIKEIGRYELDNTNIPNKPNVDKNTENNLLENYYYIQLILSVLGYKIFEPMQVNVERNELFYCKVSDITAEGVYNYEGGLTVLKGSKARLIEPDPTDLWVKEKREELIMNNILQKREKEYVFTQDFSFDSPSRAAVVILARRANGWAEWKNEKGETLDKLKRQNIMLEN